MTELIFLKLGGSVITEKEHPLTPRTAVIHRLAAEIRAVLSERPDLRLLVGHGSGSFGHAVAHRYRTQEGNIGSDSWRGYAETGIAAARLHRIVADIFHEHDIPVLSIQPSASADCHQGRLLHLELRPVKAALDTGLCPILYGDVALDDVKGFTIISTEQIFDFLARRFRPQRIVLAGMVDGVFDADPLRQPTARLIPNITPANWSQVKGTLGASHAIDVTGGMLSKVSGMLDLVQDLPQTEVMIVSGDIPGHMTQALGKQSGQIGTLIDRGEID